MAKSGLNALLSWAKIIYFGSGFRPGAPTRSAFGFEAGGFEAWRMDGAG
jgi:hypothetical protein